MTINTLLLKYELSEKWKEISKSTASLIELKNDEQIIQKMNSVYDKFKMINRDFGINFNLKALHGYYAVNRTERTIEGLSPFSLDELAIYVIYVANVLFGEEAPIRVLVQFVELLSAQYQLSDAVVYKVKLWADSLVEN